jgi:hypothetical protein
MRHMRLRIASAWLTAFVTLGAIGLLTVPTATQASGAAAAATPTQIVNFTAAPSVVSYPNPQITVSGVLETTGLSPQPLARTMLTLWFAQGAGAEAYNVKTDAAGRFKLVTTQVVPAPVVATYYGDPPLYGASSATANLTAAQVYPANVVLDPIAPAPVYSTVAVHGTLLMQLLDGSWVPSPDAPVQFDQTAFLHTFTDINGRFSIVAEAYPGHPLTISTSAGLGGTFWWSGATTAGPLFLPLSADPISVCGAIGADVTPAPAAGIGFTIHTCYVDATGAGHNYSGKVRLYFQPAAGGSRTRVSAATTGADGFAHVTVSGYLPGGGLAAGNWNWVVPAAPGFAAADTGPFPVVISVPTKITGVRFSRSGAKERLNGSLSYRTAGVPGAAVVIEHFRSGRWRQVAIVRTNAKGQFAYRFSRRLTGQYRIAYRGSALPGAEARYGSFVPTLSQVARLRG